MLEVFRLVELLDVDALLEDKDNRLESATCLHAA